MRAERTSEPELQLRAAPLPPAHVSAAISAAIRGDLARPRRSSRSWRVGVSFALAIVLGGVLTLLERSDAEHVVSRSAAYGAVGWAAVVLGLLVAGLGRFGAHTRRVQAALAVGVPLLFLGYLAAVQTSWLPLSAFLSSGSHAGSALSCGFLALCFGALAASGISLTWRRTDPFNPSGSGAIVGLVGGLAGAMSVGLVCPHREGWHLWLGHGIVVAVLAASCSMLARRVLAP